MPYRIMKEIRWEAGHRLTNYPHACKYVHGHSYRAEIHLSSATLNDWSFVEDFTVVKDKIKCWVDEHWDHAFKVHAADAPMLDFLIATDQKHYVFNSNPSAENISKRLYEVATDCLVTDRVFVDKVTVWETATSYATYDDA